MNWEVFRAYDIRGVYPTDIDEEAYYRIAKAYVYLFKPTSMVVGMDARLSSPQLKASLTKGFLDSGVDVDRHRRDHHRHALLRRRSVRLFRRNCRFRISQSQRVQRHEDGERESRGYLF